MAKKKKSKGYRTVEQRKVTRIKIKEVKLQTKEKKKEFRERAKKVAQQKQKIKSGAKKIANSLGVNKYGKTAYRIVELYQKKQQRRKKAEQAAAKKRKMEKLRQSRALVKARKRNAKLKRALAKAKGIKVESASAHRTIDQYLTEVKPAFIERFIQRLHESYKDWNPQWDATVREVLMSWQYDEIDINLRDVNLGSMYYESQTYSPNKGATGGVVYEYFKQYLPEFAS